MFNDRCPCEQGTPYVPYYIYISLKVMMDKSLSSFRKFTDVQLVMRLLVGTKAPKSLKICDAEIEAIHHEIEQRAGRLVERNGIACIDWLLTTDGHTSQQKNALNALRKKLSKNNSQSVNAELYDLLSTYHK